MTLTDYHARYFAHELTKRSSPDSVEKLAGTLVDAQVELNPHQVEAALFAFRSPLARGAILADEVGLGKTIEAGLVLSQKWAERRRSLLVVTPANLRKQWHQELTEKFFLPCQILEARSYNAAIRAGEFQPFPPAPEAVVICSYQFARSKASDVANVVWDLVVFDEAHRLRNVYKPSNVIANVLKTVTAHAPKLLLTATPLQNSLLELYGLVSFVDDHAFGDLRSFRDQFEKLEQEDVFKALKARLAPLCHRTLRRQVLEYVSYTKRRPLVEKFTPEKNEELLYTYISEYLQRENLQALPKSQRSLMTLVLRKLLASSSFAIAGMLSTLIDRLSARITTKPDAPSLYEQIEADFETLDEAADEWGEDAKDEPPLTEAGRAALEQEIRDLKAFRDLAHSITENATRDVAADSDVRRHPTSLTRGERGVTLEGEIWDDTNQEVHGYVVTDGHTVRFYDAGRREIPRLSGAGQYLRTYPLYYWEHRDERPKDFPPPDANRTPAAEYLIALMYGPPRIGDLHVRVRQLA